MQGTRVQVLVWEDPTCRGATKPVCYNYWACTLEPVSHNYWAQEPRARAPQWEARTPQRRVAPARRNWRESACSNEDPMQPKIKINKINKFIFKKRKTAVTGWRVDLEGHVGPILRHSSSRVMRSGWTWEVELQWLGSRLLVGGGGIKLSLSQCGFSGESSGGETHCFKGHPWCFLILTIWAARASGYDWWEYQGALTFGTCAVAKAANSITI